VGLRLLAPPVAELKRMFVRPAYRGRGIGAGLLAAAERGARSLGASTVRLDTRHDLVEARGLYTAHGYVEIPAYNDGPYAEHWYEKRLA
jgi:GNAT superfamily N-acetyltransferase